MGVDANTGREWMLQISRSVIEQVAPEELSLFADLAQEYLGDPRPPDLSSRRRDNPLASGLGGFEAAATPAVTAMVVQAATHLYGPAGQAPGDAMPSSYGMRERAYTRRLLRVLVDRFSDDELRTLCFELGVDYENLGGTGKAGKARELLTFLERCRRVYELPTAGKWLRPDVIWPEAPSEPRKGSVALVGPDPETLWACLPGEKMEAIQADAVQRTASMSRDELARIRALLIETAHAFAIHGDKAALMADVVIGKLALAA
jgi:hypothetical protein